MRPTQDTLSPASTDVASEKDSGLDKDDERLLKELVYYHGFLPREDLPFLLHYVGEFLVRLSEVDPDAQHQQRKREIILSVVCEGPPESKQTSEAMRRYEEQEEERLGRKKYEKRRGKIKNIIIRRMLGKYMIETTHLFDSLSDVFEYYSQKPGFLMKTMFMLLYPIRQQSWEYYHSDLQLGKILGEGAYGLVREGTLRTKSGKTVPVAIKQAKSHADLDKAKIKEMMKEARLMRLFRHKNIVRIYGVAVDEQPLLIILELVTGGALNSFLKDHGERIDTKEKISMCIGAGSGVEYLHSNECMHRDLAARNCLITKDRVVKISDFGLSRIGTQYVLKTAMKLPIKWLAPETISTFTFSLKTDVFSFGVLAYEIFANGGEPWDGLSNAEVKALVLDGKSLKFPASCPERLRDFFTHCVFAKNPAQRATMPEVVKTLKGFSAYSSLDSSGTPRRRSFLY